MSMMQGIRARPGIAIAAVARLHVEHGMVSWEPGRVQRLAKNLRDADGGVPEQDQVIVAAEFLPPGFSMSFAGMEVVGIALGSDQPLVASPDCPSVTGLGDDFFDSVSEDEILLVDGDRGRVYIAPDAMTVAHYQTSFLSQQRIFLDEFHRPAYTLSDRRLVSVFVPAASAEEVSFAMEQGADGVIWTGDEIALWDAARDWKAILDLMGGLPLLASIPLSGRMPRALVRALTLGLVHGMVEAAPGDPLLQRRISEIAVIAEQEDFPLAKPWLEWVVSSNADTDLPEDLEGMQGVVLAEEFQEAEMECLFSIAALAYSAFCPLLLKLGKEAQYHLSSALSLGVGRLAVAPEDVASVKDAIRAW